MRIGKYLCETRWTGVIGTTAELHSKFQCFATDQHLQCQEMTWHLIVWCGFSPSITIFFCLWSLPFPLMKSLFCFFLSSPYSLVLLKMYKSAVEARAFVTWVVFFIEFNLCGPLVHLFITIPTPAEWSRRKCRRPRDMAPSDLASILPDLIRPRENSHTETDWHCSFVSPPVKPQWSARSC